MANFYFFLDYFVNYCLICLVHLNSTEKLYLILQHLRFPLFLSSGLLSFCLLWGWLRAIVISIDSLSASLLICSMVLGLLSSLLGTHLLCLSSITSCSMNLTLDETFEPSFFCARSDILWKYGFKDWNRLLNWLLTYYQQGGRQCIIKKELAHNS